MNQDVDYYLIAPINIEARWGAIAPWLVQAIGPEAETCDLENIKNSAKSGQTLIWTGQNKLTGNIEMVLVGETIFYGQKPVLVLRWLCGHDIDTWLGDIGFLEHWAKERGFLKIEIWGRKGWGRIMKPYGYGFEYEVIGRYIDRGLH